MNNTETIQIIHDQLEQCVQRNDNAGAALILQKHFYHLPDELQGVIMAHMLAEAIDREVASLRKAEEMENEGLAALKALEAMRGVLER